MPSVLHNHSNIPLRREFQGQTDLLRLRCIDNINGEIPNGTARLSSAWVAVDVGAVWKDRVAGVVRPKSIVDADRIYRMPCRIGPLLECDIAERYVVVRLFRVTD